MGSSLEALRILFLCYMTDMVELLHVNFTDFHRRQFAIDCCLRAILEMAPIYDHTKSIENLPKEKKLYRGFKY